jgi:hypothetical protein
MIVGPEVVEADLVAGRLRCPVCDGPPARWGFARERQVRMREGTRSITPRRAYCQGCETTHVLRPAWAVPRRRDSAEVIGAALLDNARGMGHRRIAARLGRPPGTVRGWLRTFARRAEQVSASARRWTHAIDAGALDQTGPAGSPVADTVDALGRMARACRLQLQMSASPWEPAVTLTGLLYGRPATRPGSERRRVRASGSHRSPSPHALPAPLASRKTTAPRGERSTAEAKRSQRATYNRARPNPAAFMARPLVVWSFGRSVVWSFGRPRRTSPSCVSVNTCISLRIA